MCGLARNPVLLGIPCLNRSWTFPLSIIWTPPMALYSPSGVFKVFGLRVHSLRPLRSPSKPFPLPAPSLPKIAPRFPLSTHRLLSSAVASFSGDNSCFYEESPVPTAASRYVCIAGTKATAPRVLPTVKDTLMNLCLIVAGRYLMVIPLPQLGNALSLESRSPPSALCWSSLNASGSP